MRGGRRIVFDVFAAVVAEVDLAVAHRNHSLEPALGSTGVAVETFMCLFHTSVAGIGSRGIIFMPNPEAVPGDVRGALGTSDFRDFWSLWVGGELFGIGR